MESDEMKKFKYATFGGGCFWCIEPAFKRLKGVESVVSGYSGGYIDNPTYEAVCNGNTGHAEVVRVRYDETQISYNDLLSVFFHIHDPTTINQQGADIGEQYRSVVFYQDDYQKECVESYIHKLDESKVFQNRIVTIVEPFIKFFPAEDYHQNYFELNSGKSYCRIIISPKLEKFNQKFASLLK